MPFGTDTPRRDRHSHPSLSGDRHFHQTLPPDTSTTNQRSCGRTKPEIFKRKGGTTDRGKDYNHSTFCDLVISGLVGIRPSDTDDLVVSPLVPEGKWDWFCLEDVPYRGRLITVLWDKSGTRYGKGAGLRVFADGRLIASGDALTRVTGKLP